MQLHVHTPGPALSRFIDHFWALSDAPEHARERIFPSGTIELVVNLAEDDFRICSSPASSERMRRMPGALMSGCYSAPFEFDTRAHASVIGAHFKPAGAAAFLGVAPGEIADSHVALEDLWGRSAVELRERLCTASSTQERFRILERALRGRLPLGREPRRAVEHAVAEFGRQPGLEVGRVTRQLGLSRRRLIQIFTEDVGMTPKRYARVRRFQCALAMATREPSPHWATVALASGYFDQAHLCREWSELTGVSPSQLMALRQRPVKANHLALAEGSNPSKTRR
jgi:AraC-like DNA-binding protein